MTKHSPFKIAPVSLAGCVLLTLGGCGFTIGAVNPRPNVAVSRKVGTASVDTSKIEDIQHPDSEGAAAINLWKVSIKEFRTTLENGFRNAVGSHYASEGGATRLVFDEAELRFANFADLGRFLTIRYRLHWTDARGNVVAELAGVAQPRNPTETGRRHLEDVVEVLYEQAIDGLDKTSK
jgi:hypothetical protein